MIVGLGELFSALNFTDKVATFCFDQTGLARLSSWSAESKAREPSNAPLNTVLISFEVNRFIPGEPAAELTQMLCWDTCAVNLVEYFNNHNCLTGQANGLLINLQGFVRSYSWSSSASSVKQK